MRVVVSSRDAGLLRPVDLAEGVGRLLVEQDVAVAASGPDNDPILAVSAATVGFVLVEEVVARENYVNFAQKRRGLLAEWPEIHENACPEGFRMGVVEGFVAKFVAEPTWFRVGEEEPVDCFDPRQLDFASPEARHEGKWVGQEGSA
ncbi:MAG: hypothetical protein UX09_C0016G0018 [Candidatus Uhrbacteria bacterium GW2011_GWE2_45_35]|uniref:Uncharacterized protein n=2 Tax=Candidatus Uhriibacteriota TaxID=1752732 RepID=A0A0G1MID4_9BACT|nr:MAG: hypothetical protein UW63_C0009G0003 [Candidatus Uhrbacteria bacterium GW2011_GWF2_44_350]KKU08554.1 MAG: hypothetical protein UX09_C0016G0018 [Candidatus Uhrbacteria bacterium GW2011_GWE2_45_35]